MTVDLAAGTGLGGSAQGDTLFDIESIIGSNFDDTLIGDANDNNLNGLDGDDVFSGGAGSDRFFTGDGNDIVLFSTGDEGVTVVDFEDDVDTLDLSGMGFDDLADALSQFTDFSSFGGGTKLVVGADNIWLLGISADDLADDIDLGLVV